MLRTRHLLSTLAIVAVFAIPTRSHALEDAKPCDIRGCEAGGFNGNPGPGPGDFGGSMMPPGGDAFKVKEAERKEKEMERKKKDKETENARSGVKSIGRVKVPSGPLAASRPICDMARDARARNSPAAPNLEAQCRAAAP